MARPQSQDYDKRRQSILNEAASLIAQEGFHGSSVSDLAKRCNISKSLVYHYYSSKEEILFATMEEYTKGLLLTVKQSAETKGELKDVFAQTVVSLMQNYKSAGSSHRVLLQELDKLSAPHRKQIVANEDQIKDIIKGMIAKFNPSLKLDDPQNTALTMLFLGMVNWTHTWFDPKGAISSEQLAAMAAQVFENGVKSISG